MGQVRSSQTAAEALLVVFVAGGQEGQVAQAPARRAAAAVDTAVEVLEGQAAPVQAEPTAAVVIEAAAEQTARMNKGHQSIRKP